MAPPAHTLRLRGHHHHCHIPFSQCSTHQIGSHCAQLHAAGLGAERALTLDPRTVDEMLDETMRLKR